jgi:hypothetical protein
VNDPTCGFCLRVFESDHRRPFCFDCLPATKADRPLTPAFIRAYMRLCRSCPDVVAARSAAKLAKATNAAPKRRPSEPAPPPPDVLCRNCGSIVVGHGLARYCSQACRKDAANKRARIPKELHKVKRIPRGVCRDCGTTEGMDWSAHYKSRRNSDQTRCRPCYNAYCRANQRKHALVKKSKYVARQRPVHTCGSCQAFFEVRGRQRSSVRCEACQYRFDAERRGADFARRRKVQRAGDRAISWRTVGERDRWVCHLCSEPVKQSADSPHDPQSPTVDHITPIAVGGKHEWSNVALAHWLCNVTRGAKLLATQ